MNASEMLDYALGQLEGPDLERFENELSADPASAETASRLRQSLHQLLDDGDPIEVPAGLAGRTLQLVAEGRQRPRRSVLDFVPVTVPFRWADVAVAAGIFLAGVLTLVPALSRSRGQMEQAGCMDNLQKLGTALWQYGSIHQHYPAGPQDHPTAPTGSFAAMLHDSGILFDVNNLNCPSSRVGPTKSHLPLPTLETICRLQQVDPDKCDAMVKTDYAYNVGHLDSDGDIVPVAAVHTSMRPLLADQPAHDDFPHVYPGNSPNHGGRGQNVLYSDLHVGWHNTRRLNPTDADMYLNEQHQPAPGRHADDTTLLPSRFPFIGRGDE